MSLNLPFHRFQYNLWHQCISRIPFCRLIAILIPLIMTTLITTNAMAASVTLQWDPNDPAPDGYMFFIRVAQDTYNYNAPVWVGAAASCTISGLIPGTTYYMVVRAYVGADQSGDSNEVTYTPSDTTASNSTADTENPGSETTIAKDDHSGGISKAPSSGDSGANTTDDIPVVTNLIITHKEK